jgi:hypothetical protein
MKRVGEKKKKESCLAQVANLMYGEEMPRSLGSLKLHK